MPALIIALACVPPEPEIIPTPLGLAPPDPGIRIALALELDTAKIGGTGGVVMTQGDSGVGTALDPTARVDVEMSSGKLQYRANGEAAAGVPLKVTVRAIDSAGTVTLNGRSYRGTFEITPGIRGLQVINRVSLEDYLIGVVSAEMGPRTPAEMEALKAQAVTARSYAIRKRERQALRPYDMLASVSDQVYAGVSSENALAGLAVAATRGEVITWEGVLIDAFYFSTCSGRTEAGSDAFSGAQRPYLQSIADVDESGTAWCAISPRYTWTERWTGSQLATILKRSLPANDLAATRATDLTDLRIVDRTPTRRVASLELAGKAGRTLVTGQAIRGVLAPVAGGLLRSNDFTIQIGRQGSRITTVAIAGRGNGHGVGMCQWGAIGRARAGQDYLKILTSYFPGTEITRMYQ